jgi:shikimate dehydrogenase
LISGHTGILGVIGDPIEHTLSPAMHNAALQALGLDFVYVPFHVRPAQLPQALAGMRGLGIRGLNVTVPHKRAVIEHLDEISPEAAAIGAVNTIVNEDGRLLGHNTDVYGVIESLRRDAGLDALPPHVVLLGAGGAARAILFGLLQRTEVKSIQLLNRTVERAEELAADFDRSGARISVASLDDRSGEQITAQLVINSTSVGMTPHPEFSPLGERSGFRPGMTLLDIVYNPPTTRLMQQAEEAGARAVNGLGMLVFQGAGSFELWTGTVPPVEAMKAAALKRFAA